MMMMMMRVPDYVHALLSPKFLTAFARIEPANIPAKFEVHSFKRSCGNRGYAKHWAVPVYAHAPFSP